MKENSNITLRTLTKSNVWDLQENDIFALWHKPEKEDNISERGSQLTVSEVSGSELESLFAYIDRDIPVIVWGTQDCQPGQYTVTWNVDGKDLTWFSPEHCMALAGYSDKYVWVADPIYGEIKQYDRNVFKSCYDSLYKQAVVIQ